MLGIKRGLTTAAVALLAGAGLVACSSGDGGSDAAAGGRIAVVASTDVWGDVVQQVGGDAVSVTSVIDNPGADPHSFEADAKVKLELSRAAVVVENGGGYDDFMDTLLGSLDSKPAVINAVDVSGKAASAGDALNEHVWYDVPTVAEVATSIADALGEADPSQAATFTANATAFGAKLESLERREAELKSRYSGTGVAITEPVPVYLLDAAGLVDKTSAEFSEAVEEGTDVPASVLNETLSLFTDKQVALLVYNEQTAGAETTRVVDAAKQAGVATVPVTETLPTGKDYVSWMTANLDAVATALGGASN